MEELTEDQICRCRVCGRKNEIPPWGPFADHPSFEICLCCGTEFGYEDTFLQAVRNTRQRWLDKGAPWFEPEEKPDDWDLNEQLSEIPDEWW